MVETHDAAAATPAVEPPVGMARPSRTWRMTVSVVVLALLAAGSLWGLDDDFPFGPMRMFATSTNPSGRVGVLALYGTTADGDRSRVGAHELGMRRAEFEGQLKRFRARPELLGALAETYNDRYPNRRPLVKLELMRIYRKLLDGRVVSTTTNVESQWEDR